MMLYLICRTPQNVMLKLSFIGYLHVTILLNYVDRFRQIQSNIQIQNLLKYAYCNNDLVNYYDPTSHSAILIGLIIGAIVGAGIGYAAPYIGSALSSFSSTSFTFGSGMSLSASGVATMSAGVTITGAQILQGAGVLSAITIMFASRWKSGGYIVKKRSDDHDPWHVHIFGDDITNKADGIRIGIDGKPLPGEGKLPPGARKALRKLWEQILKALLKQR